MRSRHAAGGAAWKLRPDGTPAAYANSEKETASVASLFISFSRVDVLPHDYAAWFISAGAGAGVPAADGLRFSSKFHFQSWYTGG
jgi:hypothetical protein